MKSVTLGSVLTVGKEAFVSCTKVIRVDLGDSLVLIGECAFQNCAMLAETIVPRTLSKVGQDAFAFCAELAVVTYYGTDVEFTHLEISAGNKIFAEEALVVYRGADS
jgi:hypothetical protein